MSYEVPGEPEAAHFSPSQGESRQGDTSYIVANQLCQYSYDVKIVSIKIIMISLYDGEHYNHDAL